MYLYENTVAELTMADRDSAVEEVFHFTMEVIFSAPKSVGPAPSPLILPLACRNDRTQPLRLKLHDFFAESITAPLPG
jgi:hypothetical protein